MKLRSSQLQEYRLPSCRQLHRILHSLNETLWWVKSSDQMRQKPVCSDNILAFWKLTTEAFWEEVCSDYFEFYVTVKRSFKKLPRCLQWRLLKGPNLIYQAYFNPTLYVLVWKIYEEMLLFCKYYLQGIVSTLVSDYTYLFITGYIWDLKNLFGPLQI